MYFDLMVKLPIILNQSKWAHRDSNPEPTDYESAALTVELWAHKRRENYIIFL